MNCPRTMTVDPMDPRRFGMMPPRIVIRKLLIPLITLLVLILAGMGTMIWWQYQERLHDRITRLHKNLYAEIQVDVNSLAQGLESMLEIIAADPRIGAAMIENNAGTLRENGRDLFDRLVSAGQVTHLLFLDPQLSAIVRMHRPDRVGDQIDRFTAREAVRTGQVATGIEIGQTGTLVIRAIKPIYHNRRLAGFIELGIPVEHALHRHHLQFGDQIALAVRKQYLTQAQWENHMRQTGSKANWNDLPHSVVIYASQSPLPSVFYEVMDHHPDAGHTGCAMERELHEHDRYWRVAVGPFHDAAGRDVGCLMVMTDVTADKTELFRRLTENVAVGVVLLGLLSAMIFLLLRRTDAIIARHQAALKQSEERMRIALDNVDACVYIADMKTHEVLYINAYARQRVGDSVGKPCWQVMQGGMTGPCPFCTNDKLLLPNGKPAPVHHWEFQNTITGRWYDCRDKAIPWLDGRLVRMEIATDITERREREQELADLSAKLQALSRRLQATREEETRRIAVWLHDEIGQMLTRARMDAMLIEDGVTDRHPATLDSLSSLKLTLDNIVNAVRNISTELRPAILDDFGLAAAIEWSIREDEKRLQIPITINARDLPDNLDPDIAIGFYRMARECMTNIARHAGATSASVQLTADAATLTMTIRDNGRGMSQDADRHPLSFGLAQLRERAEALNGSVHIESRPDQGVTVHIRVPLQQRIIPEIPS